MSKFFYKRPCNMCGQRVSNAGFAQASHKRKHVREGLMVEVTDFGSLAFDYTDAGQQRIRERRAEEEKGD